MHQSSASRVFDYGFAAVVTALGIAETWVPFASRQGEGSATGVTVCIVLAGLALTQRRRHPLAAGLVVLWAWPVIFAVTQLPVLFLGQFVPMAIALFSVARYGAGRAPYVGAAAGASTLLFFDLFVEVLQAPGEILFHWGVFTIVWFFGWSLHRFEDRARTSTQRAVEAEVAVVRQTMAAVVEERARIARELHDVVAHSVSLMVVQAGAAEQVVLDDPHRARQALETIRTTGAEALAEMRRVVEMLRDGDQPGALEPQPGLLAVEALVDEAGETGLSASLTVHGERGALPPGVDLAAFRILQEALTNVRRHARATRVDVRVGYEHDAVCLEVTDDGVGCDEPVGGHGLVGMRERAALYGGSVDTLPRAGGGFSVRAVLPLRADR